MNTKRLMMSFHIANAIFIDDKENVKIKFMNWTRDIFDRLRWTLLTRR